MPSTLHIPAAWTALTVVATVFVIVYPFILGSIARKRLGVGWKYFWFGALIFLVFQLLTRVPLILALTSTVLAPLLRTSITFTWSWLIIEAVTAGLFEEIGRYIGYRLFMRREPKTWSKAVMYGLGHEGLESMVVVGGGHILTLLTVISLSAININSLPIAQRQTILQQVAAINAQPIWFPLLAAWERFWSFPLQVALSVTVLQVFRRQQMRWLFLAILFHALIDFLSLALPQAFGQSTTSELLVEGMICVFGLIGVWFIWRLREPEERVAPEKELTPF
ncbi:MAG TPA: YhfC family glutamic-type intramembrane protease [Ktedonobacteraceae bacterium]|nr:YhfC family glutamic-type intramembrane protease [Ktedonobacteraceae bacterium]